MSTAMSNSMADNTRAGKLSSYSCNRTNGWVVLRRASLIQIRTSIVWRPLGTGDDVKRFERSKRTPHSSH